MEEQQQRNEIKRRARAKAAAEELANFCNEANAEDIRCFVAQLVEREHRTLQQRVCRLFLACFAGWAKASHDLRNEATVEAAKQITALGIFLPHI